MEKIETKDITKVFQMKLSSFKEQPKEGSQFIIVHNLKEVITKILREINEFTNTNFVKEKFLKSLIHVIVVAENNITQYLESIIKTLAKFLNDEDTKIQTNVEIAAELTGYYTQCNVYVPLIINLISDEESKNNLKYLTNLLTIFSLLLKSEKSKLIEPYISKISELLGSLETVHQDNEDILKGLYLITEQIVKISGENCAIYCRQLFTLLLTVQATTKFGQTNSQAIEQIMLQLATNCGYKNVSDLHANEVSILLEQFKVNQSYKTWTKYCKDKQKFIVIIRNCQQGIVKFMPIILEIIQTCLDPEKEVELKIDMLVILEFIISLKQIEQSLKENAQQIIAKSIIPSMVWRVGKPQTKIRKAAIINLIKIIDGNLIEPQDLVKCIPELIPPIKTCLSDDWGPDLRFVTCNLCEKLFLAVKEVIGFEQIHDLYTSFLERLDDAQDSIRIEITKTFIVVFSCKSLRESNSSIFDYMIKAIFIHLDDQSEDIQMNMFQCLKFAARSNPKKVLQEAKQQVSRMKQPRKCQELVNFAQELFNELTTEESTKIQEEKK